MLPFWSYFSKLDAFMHTKELILYCIISAFLIVRYILVSERMHLNSPTCHLPYCQLSLMIISV